MVAFGDGSWIYQSDWQMYYLVTWCLKSEFLRSSSPEYSLNGNCCFTLGSISNILRKTRAPVFVASFCRWHHVCRISTLCDSGSMSIPEWSLLLNDFFLFDLSLLLFTQIEAPILNNPIEWHKSVMENIYFYQEVENLFERICCISKNMQDNVHIHTAYCTIPFKGVVIIYGRGGQ